MGGRTDGSKQSRLRRPKAGAAAEKVDVRVLAREAALAALTRLAQLANSDDERIALAASQELLNRAFGKSPVAAAEDQSSATQPLIVRIVRWGAADPEAEPAQDPERSA